MYEDLLANCLTCLALLTAFARLGELIRAYILYDMSKRASQKDPAGNDLADKLQWRYYLAGVCSQIEAHSAATTADTRSLEPRGCLYWSIDCRAGFRSFSINRYPSSVHKKHVSILQSFYHDWGDGTHGKVSTACFGHSSL